MPHVVHPHPANLRSRPPPPPPSPPAGRSDDDKERIADECLGGVRLVVDREKLREVVEKDMGKEVVSVAFLGSGTFHKCYLVSLKDAPPVVARICQPYFPTKKTSSEVATIAFLHQHTSLPIPTIFAYDSTSSNPLGAEYTLESLAPGTKLSSLSPSSLPRETQHALVRSLARLLVPLFTHRFPRIGSLYFSAPTLSRKAGFEVGPIVSWPFFGNERGLRADETEEEGGMDRGPWETERAYFEACVKREMDDVRRESGERHAKDHHQHPPHHPGSIGSGSASSPSDAEEEETFDSASEEDYDDDDGSSSVNSAGSDSMQDMMYRAYRSTQSVTTPFRRFSASDAPKSRFEMVKEDMERFMSRMEELGMGGEEEAERDGFRLDLHDVRAENIFVDPEDPSRITCIIDFECTTLRPPWLAAHLPALLLPPPSTAQPFTTTAEDAPSPFATPELQKVFREEAEKVDLEWSRWEREGEERRRVHRLVEWDGWEVGLGAAVLGPS